MGSKARKKRPAGRAPRRLRLPAIRDRRRALALAQDAAIALLLCTAVLLAGASGLFGDLQGSVLALGGYAEPERAGYGEAARPLCLVLTPEAGAHCAALYDGQAVDEAYAQLSSSLAEALGSSEEPEAVGEARWRAALSGAGAYFDFTYDQPLALLAGWLGTAVSGGAHDHTARRLCLAIEDGGVWLYYLRARDGGAYRCATALDAAELRARLAGFLPNGAAFCFELGGFSLVDPYAVLPSGQTEVPLAAAESAQDLLDIGTVMDALGMNSYLATTYPESDGTRVSVEGSATLRLEPDGRLRYSRSVGGDLGLELLPADAVELARAVAEATVGACAGAARLTLSYVGRQPDTGEYVVCFDYVLGGLPVSLPDGEHAAQLHIRGASVVRAAMVFRSYALLEGVARPLRALQQAAVVEAAGGGEPFLAYADDLDGVAVKWLVR